MPWCKTELEKRFASLVIYDGPLGKFQFCGLKSIDGSIGAHVRRGRRFVMYEYNMSFNWNGLFFVLVCVVLLCCCVVVLLCCCVVCVCLFCFYFVFRRLSRVSSKSSFFDLGVV